jgi:hypothetical protein
MRVHYRSLRIFTLISALLLFLLWGALSVNLQTRNSNQGKIRAVTQAAENANQPTRPPSKGFNRPLRDRPATTDQPADTQPTPDPRQKKPAKPVQTPEPQKSDSPKPYPQKPDPQPGQPQQFPVSLSANKTLIQLGETVNFRLEPELRYTFMFDFGDGTPPLAKDANAVSIDHQFLVAGSHAVLVRAVVPAGVAGPGSGIKSVTIAVEQVRLSPVTPSVEVGVPISLTATSVSKDPNLRYRFSFGDDKQTDWQTSNEASHSYSTAHPYQPKVEVGFAGNSPIVSIDSNSARVINVVLPRSDSLVFHVEPSRVKANEPVSLSAEFPAKERHIQYRFLFDDGGSSKWQDENHLTHSYRGGTYQPVVEVGVLLDGAVYTLATSTPQKLEVIASPSNPLWPWFLVAIGVGLIILAAFVFGGYKVAKLLFPPEPSFVAHMEVVIPTLRPDAGSQLVSFELELNPNLSGGLSDLFTNEPRLIRAERNHL